MASPTQSPGLPLDELASRTGARVDGDGSCRVERVATLEGATRGAIAFLANPRYRAQLSTTRASAVIVAPQLALATPLPKLVSDNPYATYAKVARILHPAPAPTSGIHPTAVVDATARVPASARIDAHACIGVGATIGERASIGAGCIIGERAVIGDDARLHANAVVYDDCIVGARTIIHGGAVIGADGFGMAEEAGRWIKIPQIGRVVVGADVEIGANTTIDRGAIDDTVIEDDVKLDNQIQVGHNCRIGAHTAIAGCVGIAGSTHIGRNCKIGGAAMISGHLEIVDGVVVSGATQVFDSIKEPGVYTGTFPALPHRSWRQIASRVRRLRELEERIEALERARTDNEGGGR
jgi:UDP-3-O-[3-hydroxymyristoyl] glucosamine N-acyltransferase